MDLSEAIRVARKTLFDYGGIALVGRNMYAQDGRDQNAVARAKAYNLLAKYHRDIEKTLPIIEEEDDAEG